MLALFGLGAVGYGALCTLVYLKQDQLLYFPSRHLQTTPEDLGLTSEWFDLPTTTGTVTGWLVEAPAPKAPWVIIFHGNAGNISSHIGHLPFFHRLGFHAVLFDYEGYGRSQGVPTEASLVEGGLVVREYLEKHKGARPADIVYFGESLGGGVAAATAQRAQPAALLLKSTFTSVPDRAAQSFPYLPVRLLARTKFDTLARVQDFDFPKLIMHGPADEVIPYEHGQTLMERAKAPKQWLELRGGHNTPPSALGEEYAQTVKRFVLDATIGASDAPP